MLLHTALILFAFCVVVWLIDIVTTLVFALIVGVTVEAVGLFVGPPIFRKTIRGIRFQISILPMGTYVRMKSPPPGISPEQGDFSYLSRPTRMLLILCPLMLLLAFLASVLGPGALFNWLAASQVNFFRGAWFNGGDGVVQAVVQAAAMRVTEGKFLMAFVCVAAGQVAINILPLSMVRGGMFLSEVLAYVSSRRVDIARNRSWGIVGIIAFAVPMFIWIVRIIRIISIS